VLILLHPFSILYLDLLAKDVEVFSTYIFRAVTENCYRFNMIRHVRICIGGRHLCQPILATLAKLQETDGSQNGMYDIVVSVSIIG